MNWRQSLAILALLALMLFCTSAATAELAPSSLVAGDFSWRWTGRAVIHEGDLQVYDVWPTLEDMTGLQVVHISWSSTNYRGSFPFGQRNCFTVFQPRGLGPVQLSCVIIAYRPATDEWLFGLLVLDVLVVQ